MLSDNAPIVLNVLNSAEGNQKRNRRFRFEAMWVRDPSCEGILGNSWDSLDDSGQVDIRDKINRDFKPDTFIHSIEIRKVRNSLIE